MSCVIVPVLKGFGFSLFQCQVGIVSFSMIYFVGSGSILKVTMIDLKLLVLLFRKFGYGEIMLFPKFSDWYISSNLGD